MEPRSAYHPLNENGADVKTVDLKCGAFNHIVQEHCDSYRHVEADYKLQYDLYFSPDDSGYYWEMWQGDRLFQGDELHQTRDDAIYALEYGTTKWERE